MSARIAAFDWASTPVGPIEGWPQSLKTITGFMMRSPTALVLLWGPDGVMIYNDSYSIFAGDRHPSLLGSKVLEGWPEAAELNARVMRVGLSSGTLSYTDLELELNRTGTPKPAWLDLDYSPVIDESGKPAGVMAVVVETTSRVLAERRTASARQRQEQHFSQMPGFVAMLSGPEHVYDYVNAAYVRVAGERDFTGRPIRAVFPDLEGQGFFELLDQVYTSGERYVTRAAPIQLAGEAEVRFLDFVYEPIRDDSGAVSGVFVGGYDVTEAQRAQRDLETSRERYRGLAELSVQLRDLSDPDQIGFAAARLLGGLLQTSRVGYGTIDPENETLHVSADWTAPGIDSLAGVTPLRDYGSFIDSLKRGELIQIDDVRRDKRTAMAAEALEGRSARAFVNVPVIEQGQLVAVLYVNDAGTRRWTSDEMTLISEVAERTRTAVERARSDAAVRESEARLRFLDELSRAVGRISDADEVLRETTRMTGQHMGVSICAYADMDEDEDGFTIRGDWAAPGSSSIVGHYRLADFGTLAVENLSAGRPMVVNDNRAELAPEEAAAFQAIGISATICMPLVKDGRLVALMAIHDKQPRAWTEDELALINDVTIRSWAHVQRVAAEAELRASEDNFRTLASAMPNQVWTAPADGQLDWFNDQVYAYSGAERGSLDGAGWAAIVHPDDLDGAVASWTQALAGGEPYQTEFRLRRHDGAWRWHLARAVPLKSNQGEVLRWVGTNTDIQDQKDTAEALAEINDTLEQRVEERTAQLMEAEAALRQAQKMEAVGQLTGGIAHDFNNLLTGIAGSLELLQKRLNEGRSDGVERYIDIAQTATRRASSLTQRLLAFSRRQTLDPKPTDVNRLVAGMEDLIRRTVGPGVEVEVVGAGGLWNTRVDQSQLENALLNLSINARDAMPDGGRITIETANKWLDQRAARERELPPGQYVSLCVTDTGTGMTPEVISRAFDPFFTTKPIGQGTGLGLSMIHGFARQSGGQVRIYSELGKGTTMCLYFPRYAGRVDAPEPPEDAADVATSQGETVLVIDDEKSIRDLLSEVLGEAGYRVLEAADGPSGLAILQSGARVDLLITDVGLPGGLNGRQVADAARAERPDLKVLFVTGYAENAVVGNGHLDAGMQVMTKPFAIAALATRVRDIIEG